jgi:hypothetical protein
MYMLRVAMETVARLNVHIRLRGYAIPVSLLVFDKTAKATVILSTGDFTQTVDRVKAVIACHVFSVAGRPVAGDFVARVEGACQLKYNSKRSISRYILICKSRDHLVRLLIAITRANRHKEQIFRTSYIIFWSEKEKIKQHTTLHCSTTSVYILYVHFECVLITD